MRKRFLALAAAAAAVALAALAAGCFGGGDREKPRARARPEPLVPPADLTPKEPAKDTRPNIVFVLTDDLSWNLVRHMPNVKRLQRRGVTFSRYFVTDSLCCPSRASIFTGRLPHNTKIFTNTPPDGGFHLFRRRREERSTFATALRSAGYGTAMMGKYLNGYMPLVLQRSGNSYVPPGWSEWDVAGNGYPEYLYAMNENGTVVQYGHRPQDYLTDVIAGKGLDFIRDEARAGRPFMLELATFAPHSPYTPAPQDRGKYPFLKAPRVPSFNRRNSLPPRWLDAKRRLPPPAIQLIDRGFRKRVRSVQAVDRMLGRIEATLEQAGVARNTYVVFSSDNGFHMGEHRLLPGKLTAFDHDIRVPLVVAGPNVPHGKTVKRMTANIDLAPTFAALARTRMSGPVDGRSIAPLIHGRHPRRWRRAVLIEHRGPVQGQADPDFPSIGAGNPPSYEAVRTQSEVYVEYASGEGEYYDLRRDPSEMHNLIDVVPERRLVQLHRMLRRLVVCRRERACWAAARPK